MEKTYVAIQYGGYYGQRCAELGYINVGECCVIEYSQFMRFMNQGEVTRPMFTSRQYGVCVEVARDLNESANEIELQRHLKEWVNARETL